MRIRNTAWIFLALFLEPVASLGAVRVISDIDDTTKITNVGSPLLSVWNGLFGARSFSGMSDLYSALAIERGYAFDYVTGAPVAMKGRVRHFLKKNGFPEGELHLKPLSGAGNLRVYKTRAVLKILATYPKDKFILIGDDTQHDFAVYDDVYKSMPDRIIAIYIRKVTNRPLPPSTYPFLSAFDIAFTEYLMNRMTVNEVAPSAISILSERRDRRIVPRFTHCPSSNFPLVVDPRVKKWKNAITDRIQKICKVRNLPADES